MKVILKTKAGYLNTENEVKICNKEDATVFYTISNAIEETRKIYKTNPMIGKITTEISK